MIPTWHEINKGAYSVPTVVCFQEKPSQWTFDPKPLIHFAIVGTAYGFWHTSGGDIRVWKTRSGATRALKCYVPI